MLHLPLAALLLLGATTQSATDSIRREAVRADSMLVEGGPRAGGRRAGAVRQVAADTGRAVAVEYSDWYERRLTIHKRASYAMLPLFAFQYAAGQQLYENSTNAPAWAKTGHRIAATGTAALFTVNTVTGVWNLVEGRKDPEGRKWRTAHGVLMLLGDAGFTATGILAERAERSPGDRSAHRNIALASVAVSTVSYLMMLPPFRRD